MMAKRKIKRKVRPKKSDEQIKASEIKAIKDSVIANVELGMHLEDAGDLEGIPLSILTEWRQTDDQFEVALHKSRGKAKYHAITTLRERLSKSATDVMAFIDILDRDTAFIGESDDI